MSRRERIHALLKKAPTERVGRFYALLEGLDKKGPRQSYIKRGPRRGQMTDLFGLKTMAHEEAVNYRRGSAEIKAFDKGKRQGYRAASRILKGGLK